METKYILKMVKEDGSPLSDEGRLLVLSTYSDAEILHELTKRGYAGKFENNKSKDILVAYL